MSEIDGMKNMVFGVMKEAVTAALAGAHARVYKDATTSVSRADLLGAMCEDVMGSIDGPLTEILQAVRDAQLERQETLNVLRSALVERNAYIENLNATIDRCSKLLEENRELKKKTCTTTEQSL